MRFLCIFNKLYASRTTQKKKVIILFINLHKPQNI